MASCVRNIRSKKYQNLKISFQVTVENVGDVFLTQCRPTIGIYRVVRRCPNFFLRTSPNLYQSC